MRFTHSYVRGHITLSRQRCCTVFFVRLFFSRVFCVAMGWLPGSSSWHWHTKRFVSATSLQSLSTTCPWLVTTKQASDDTVGIDWIMVVRLAVVKACVGTCHHSRTPSHSKPSQDVGPGFHRPVHSGSSAGTEEGAPYSTASAYERFSNCRCTCEFYNLVEL